MTILKTRRLFESFIMILCIAIKQSKYSFIDINLFKEDFIYYIYKLSDLDSLKNAQKNELLPIQTAKLKIWIITKKNNKTYLIVLNNLPLMIIYRVKKQEIY